MKTFSKFCAEAYDDAFMSGAQVIRTGEGGRIDRKRTLTPTEKRRKSEKIGPDGKRLPTDYKPRKDIGVPKPTSVTVQQPEGERGSSKVAAALMAASKEERKKAALKRIAAKKSGESSTETKAKPKDLTTQASKLLSTKSSEVDLRPKDQPKRKVVGPKRADRTKIIRDGGRKLRDLLIAAKSKKLGIPPNQVKLDKSFDIK